MCLKEHKSCSSHTLTTQSLLPRPFCANLNKNKQKNITIYWYFVTFSYTKMTHEVEILQDLDPFFLQSQYHGCWWPGDTKSQGISSHVIDLIIPQYSICSTRRVKSHQSCTLHISSLQMSWWVRVHRVWISAKYTLLKLEHNIKGNTGEFGA